MKEIYTAPKCDLFALSADAYLANSEFEMDELIQNGDKGVISNPDVDIDVPLIPGL